MGTSSSYGGPRGNSPLLPDDFFDGNESNDASDPQEETPPSEPDEQKSPPVPETQKPDLWSYAKSLTSKYAGGSVNSYRKPLAAHVKASGGARKAASSARSGKSTTISLGNFLSNISTSGIRNTLSNYRIEYENRNVDEVLSDLINQIAPSPDTKEDAVARSAFLDAMEYLYEEVEQNGGDLEAFDRLDAATFETVIKTYISSYIYQRFLKDLGSRFENKADSIEDILSKEQEIKDYIQGVVENTINDSHGGQLDFNSQAISNQIDTIYNDCYEVIEGVL